jgi:hypothetical protein
MKVYSSIEELQVDLDAWLRECNESYPLLLESTKQLDGIAPVGSHGPITIRAATDRTAYTKKGYKINLTRMK